MTKIKMVNTERQNINLCILKKLLRNRCSIESRVDAINQNIEINFIRKEEILKEVNEMLNHINFLGREQLELSMTYTRLIGSSRKYGERKHRLDDEIYTTLCELRESPD